MGVSKVTTEALNNRDSCGWGLESSKKKQYRHRYRVLVNKGIYSLCDISKQIGIMSSNWRKHVVSSPLDRQRLMFRLLSCVTGACRHRGTVFIRAPDSHFRSRDKKTALQDKPVIRLRALCWEGGSDLNLRGSVSQRV